MFFTTIGPLETPHATILVQDLMGCLGLLSLSGVEDLEKNEQPGGAGRVRSER